MNAVGPSWLASIGIGLITAIIAAVVGGLVADLSVSWYRISSREGASGYYVVMLALLALVVGLAVGIVAARVVAERDGGFLRALLAANGATLGLIAVVGGIARLLADVPPRYQGEELLLALEVSWPEGQAPVPDARRAPRVELLSLAGNTVRRGSKTGPLWFEDARREGGRVIVPGVVKLWTERGNRLVRLLPSGRPEKDDGLNAVLAVPRRPGRAAQAWSAWQPLGAVQVRWRVVPEDEPLRRTTLGPFTVEALAGNYDFSGFDPQPSYHDGIGFVVRHRGTPVTFPVDSEDVRLDTGSLEDLVVTPAEMRVRAVSGVSIIPGDAPALVVRVDLDSPSMKVGSRCHLVQPGDAAPRITPLGECTEVRGRLLEPRPDGAPPPVSRWRYGDVDRAVFAVPGPYLFARALLDTRTLTVRGFAPVPEPSRGECRELAPVALSPDGARIARLDFVNDSAALAEVPLDGGAQRTTLVGDATVPTGLWQDVDAAWFAHWFEWVPDGAGSYRVARRAGVKRMPYRGHYNPGAGDEDWRFRPARPELRDALIAALPASLGIEPLPGGDETYRELRIGGVKVTFSSRPLDDSPALRVVGLYSDERRGERVVFARVAAEVDALLASGRFDDLVAPGPMAFYQ